LPPKIYQHKNMERRTKTN